MKYVLVSVSDAPSVMVRDTVFDPLVLYVTKCGPIEFAVAGTASDPKSQLYVVLPVVPVDILLNVTVDPIHTGVGVPVKSALRLQPARLKANVFIMPTHPDAFVSVTVTFPLVVPKVTVILFVPAPAVMVAPEGTVHA
jgi:hypothetical protein